MKRWTFLIYGVICHLLFFATYAYMAGFVGNLVVPKSIDAPPTSVATSTAISINLALVALFALQHSVMARPWFKQVWTRFVPKPIERSTYVLVSCIAIAIWMWLWQPLDSVIWDVRQPLLRALLWLMFVAGWLLVPLVSLMINHFDLFGTRQAWLYFQGRQYESLAFRTPQLYAHVRHPLYLGWALAFWATPTMTAGHLLFATTTTIYMGLAAKVEERDLLDHFGQRYADYRRHVPMFLPSFARRTDDRQASAVTPDNIVIED